MSNFVAWILTPAGRWALTGFVFIAVLALKNLPAVKKLLTSPVSKQLTATLVGMPTIIAAGVEGAPIEDVGGLVFQVLLGSIGVHDFLGGLSRQFPVVAAILKWLGMLGSPPVQPPPPRASADTVPDRKE